MDCLTTKVHEKKKKKTATDDIRKSKDKQVKVYFNKPQLYFNISIQNILPNLNHRNNFFRYRESIAQYFYRY